MQAAEVLYEGVQYKSIFTSHHVIQINEFIRTAQWPK